MKKALTRIFVVGIALLFISSIGLAAEQIMPVKSAGIEMSQKMFAADEAPFVNINTASKETLMTLPGIGAVYAEKIIAGRPYAQKDQLKSRKIIPFNVYEKIKSRIITKQLS